MAKLDMIISHKLSEDEALKRIKGLLGEVRREYGDKITDLSEQWDGNKGFFSFSAMGFSISGSLIVRSSHIELFGKLPFAASFFKGRIETTIRERANALLV